MSDTTVRLTDEEKRMLNGDQGFVRQRCMEYLVELAEVSGAENLVDLDGTGDMHTPQTAQSPHYEFSLEELEKLVATGARFKIPTFANKSPFPCLTPVHGWEKCGIAEHEDPKFHEMAMREDYMSLYRKMGMMTTHSCAYYLTSSFWPTMGQHCAWNESSAIPWANAVLGARANIDGNFATCFLGKTANEGMHLDKNRLGKNLFKVERKFTSDMEWDMLGFAVGEMTKTDVPVIVGVPKPNTTQLQKMNSAMNTGGNIEMYHIPGTTPEAHCVEEAFGGAKPQQEFVIGEEELHRVYDLLNYREEGHNGDVDMVSLGCPHLNIVDLMQIAHKLEGKKCKVPLWIMTAPWLYNVAKDLGYLEVFNKAGATLLDGTCPACIGKLTDNVMKGARTLAVDSAKQSYYITGCFPDTRLNVCYGTQDDCIDAALTGKWHGEWR